jgi:hypothetical protein
MDTPSYEFVERAVRKKTFGVFTTVDPKGRPHSTGILYGVSPPSAPLAMYMLTMPHYIKVRNVEANPQTTLVVPFPHRILGFVPANCVTFRGHTEVVPLSDEHGRWAFARRRILRDNMKWLEGSDAVFPKLTPDPKVNCYGLGISLREIRRNHTAGGYSVTIPAGVRGRS